MAHHPDQCRDTAPLKVFILAGQSNMVGLGYIKHLDELVTDPRPDNEYRDLWNPETKSYRTFDDVYVVYEKACGKLTIAANSGFAASGTFGPEVMFGRTVADALAEHEKPILLIKTAWGGKSLAVDFRPPSSSTANSPIHAGNFYRLMLQIIQSTLANLPKYVPGYTSERGYELAGLAWLQGWNDMLNWPTVNEYGDNLAHLIRDIRRDLNVPKLPVVIGELGQHGLKDGPKLLPNQRWTSRVLAFREQQKGVTLRDEFRDNTLFVPTAEFTVLEKPSFNGEFHYSGRADTFYRIGRALGEGMNTLLQKKKLAAATATS